ncbi:DUF922 domain-containing protein [Crocinitomix catalasitica]|nr:DUF922 domain-containing protein [Crocinitomix catalasitica]
MKTVLILTSVLLLGFTTVDSGSPEQKGGNYFYWTEGKVVWKQFKGKVPEDSPYSALTYSAIDLQIEGMGDKLGVKVNTVFDPKQSWKTDAVTDYLLKHEQLHFDITEYHSRLLREKISELKFKSFDDIGDDIQAEFIKISDAADEMQVEYDAYTDHAKVKIEQLKWNKKVRELLDSKSDFSDSDLTIDISYLK